MPECPICNATSDEPCHPTCTACPMCWGEGEVREMVNDPWLDHEEPEYEWTSCGMCGGLGEVRRGR